MLQHYNGVLTAVSLVTPQPFDKHEYLLKLVYKVQQRRNVFKWHESVMLSVTSSGGSDFAGWFGAGRSRDTPKQRRLLECENTSTPFIYIFYLNIGKLHESEQGVSPMEPLIHECDPADANPCYHITMYKQGSKSVKYYSIQIICDN